MRIPDYDMQLMMKKMVCTVAVKNVQKARIRLLLARPFFTLGCLIAGISGVEVREE